MPKGKPPKKVRERDGEIEYEEWIYGEPPADVDFVRIVGEEVVRVETMKVGRRKNRAHGKRSHPGAAGAGGKERAGSAAAERAEFASSRGGFRRCAQAGEWSSPLPPPPDYRSLRVGRARS